MRLLEDRVETPTGRMVLLADEQGNLRALDWESHAERLDGLLRRHYGSAVERQPAQDPYGLSSALSAYMAGELQALAIVPVATAGTAFQRAVWESLRRIPAGTTTTYGALAAGLGMPSAARAVGLANGANPIAIAVPCHRVVGANGALTGFGGGIERKQWLLAHERLARGQTDLFP